MPTVHIYVIVNFFHLKYHLLDIQQQSIINKFILVNNLYLPVQVKTIFDSTKQDYSSIGIK
jgi:hypothetical protein